jgi:hypothetical protein
MITHGTRSGYNHHKCRCTLCSEANSAFAKAYRDKKKLEDAVEHGTTSSYFYRGCRCEVCALVPKQVYALKSDDSKKRIRLKAVFGMSLEEYNDMVMSQCGLCSVCGELETKVDSRTGDTFKLSVHHSHKTGKVIALCCKTCNAGMGYLKDDPKLLMFAAELNKEDS